VIEAEHADPQRVFVAGLSAGAAMAVILGNTHPDVFKAVGAHSGLPHGAANGVGSAFAAMKGSALFSARPSARNTLGAGAPTIVFHGDADATVVAANATAIIEQAVAATDPNASSASTRARCTLTWPGTCAPSSGCCTAECTRGRAATRRVRTPTRRGPMRRPR